MGQLIVKSIAVSGFGSYSGTTQKLTLNGGGAMAVVGKNGAGKSTIVSKALTWCLYGKTAPERMGSGTGALRGKAVVNEASNACLVRVELVDDSGDTITITRSRMKNKADVIEVDHETMQLASTQATIDALMGAGYDVFVRTVVRGQGDPWNFAEATDARKREILDVVSGADALAIPFERAKKLARARATLAEQYRKRADDALRRAQAVRPEDLQRKVIEWDNDHKRRIQEAKDEERSLKELWTTAQQADALISDNDAARKQITDNWPKLDRAPYTSALLEAQTWVTQTQAQLATAKQGTQQAQQLLASGKCPTCQQAIAPGSPVHAVATADMAPFEQAVINASKHRQQCQDALSAADQWLRDAEQRAHQALEALPAQQQPRAPHAHAAYTAAVRRRQEVEKAENPWRAAMEQARAQEEALTREVAVLREAQQIEEREHRSAQLWVDALHPKGVRAALTEGALVAIETEANKWLSILSAGQMTVAFPPHKEGKKSTTQKIETVVRWGDQVRPLLAFSGGEKRRINFAVDLGVAAAFARGGTLALSLLVLDEEVFSGMDDEGKHAMVQAIAHSGVRDVVVIDHDSRLSGVLPRTVRVGKDDLGYSRIEEDTCCG